MSGDVMAGPTAAEQKKYEAENDLRTLIDAEAIKKDKPRMAAAMKCRKDKMAAMAAVAPEKSA